MTLTQISTAGVKDDAVTSGKIPANAVGSSELADNAVDTAAIANDAVTNAKIADNAIENNQLADGEITAAKLASNSVTSAKIVNEAVQLEHLPHGTSSNDGKFLRANNGADPTFETVNTDLVSDTSPQLGGDLQSNGSHIFFADNDKAIFGAGNDLEIHHRSSDSDSVIMHQNENGHLRLLSGVNGNGGIKINNRTDSAAYIHCNNEGSVDLYHNGNKRFETTSSGTLTSGVLAVNDATSATAGNRISVGASEDLKIYHIAGADSYIRNANGDTYLQGNNAGTPVNNIVFQNGNGATEFYYNNTKTFETKDLSASSDSGELGIKFINNKAIQFHDNQIGIFTATFSMNANTWTTMFTHDSYVAVTIHVSSIHNAGFSSATWIMSKSASGGNSTVRTGLNDAYGPARLETRINSNDFQIRSSYGTYGYLLCLVQYNMNNIRNING
jgi:hypothetical protein